MSAKRKAKRQCVKSRQSARITKRLRKWNERGETFYSGYGIGERWNDWGIPIFGNSKRSTWQ